LFSIGAHAHRSCSSVTDLISIAQVLADRAAYQ
jgi:hypothetical protein